MKILAYIAMATLTALLASEAAAETVRFAIVVGANRGGDGTQPLRFAERDAERFAKVLGEVGGVSAPRIALLPSPSAVTLRRAFDRIEAAIRAARTRPDDRIILIFFYSGHSDGVNLELGSSDRLRFGEVRARLERSAAHVRLAFVDSCKSGGITENKGLARGPSFDLALSDETDVGGAAFVTSSSASERAQESSEVGGSYFTHFLISALRGAADNDGNGRVTLSETYQYAFAKTVAETARTVAGPQHPSYAYKLSGRGDLTLADLREAAATIRFPAGAGGTYLVIDGRRKELLAEVVQPPREPRRLAVPRGDYVVGRREGDRFLATRINAVDGREATVAEAELRAEPLTLALAKGWDADLENAIAAGYTVVGGALGTFNASNEVALSYRRALASSWHAMLRGGIGFASVDASGLMYRYRAVHGDLAVLRGFSLPAMRLYLGANVGSAYATQTLLSGEDQQGVVFRYGAVTMLELPIVAGLSANLIWDLGATAVRLNGELTQRLLVRAGIGVGYAF